MQLSENIKDLYGRLAAIHKINQVPSEEIEKIKVSEVIGKLAFFYEKLRNTMDYQEDHLLRRFSIERTLKRHIVLETLKPKIAESLIENLIRSGYIPNNTLPESIISTIAVIINKYAYLLELSHDEIKDPNVRGRVTNWITGVMACEIDVTLVPEDRVDALIENLYLIVRDRIKFTGSTLSVREKNIQLYITIHRELVKSDDSIISYHLLNLYFSDWAIADRKLVEFLASKITAVYYGIQKHCNNPIRFKIAKRLNKHIVSFRVLRELIVIHQNNLLELFSNPNFFEVEVKKVLERVYKSIRKKIQRYSIKAILYIFITKMILALAIEYPYELKIVGNVNYLTLIVNILFPVVLIFLVTLSAKMPGSINSKLIIQNLKNILYGDPEQEILCELKVRNRYGPIIYFMQYVFYIMLYGFIFGILIYLLQRLNFNILSGAIFIFFVTAVSFFGTRIRQLPKEYLIESTREGFINVLVIFFTLPIIRAGQWFSINLKRINLFAFILDFVIEAPFKLLLELIESWFTFLREKHEDTYKNT